MSLKHSRRVAANLVFTGFCWVATVVALTALTAILWALVLKGAAGINLDVFTMSTPSTGSRGGLLNAIVGSVIMCGIAMIIGVLVAAIIVVVVIVIVDIVMIILCFSSSTIASATTTV